jgi:hypothetical protein
MRDFLCGICRGAWGGQVGLARSVWRKLAAHWHALASRRENYPLSPTPRGGCSQGGPARKEWHGKRETHVLDLSHPCFRMSRLLEQRESRKEVNAMATKYHLTRRTNSRTGKTSQSTRITNGGVRTTVLCRSGKPPRITRTVRSGNYSWTNYR